MRILILFLLLLSCYGADSKLPSDVQALLTAYDKDMAKIQADADAASAARTEKLRSLLVKAQEAATKKGDLDSAMAVKGEIDKLGTSAHTERKAELHTSKDVIIYSLPNFKGVAAILKQYGTVQNVQTLSFPNDGLRSIKVPAGVTVTVYQNENSGGGASVLTQDVADLTGTEAVGMTSLMLEKK